MNSIDTIFIDTIFIDTIFIDTIFIDTIFIDIVLSFSSYIIIINTILQFQK